MSSVALVTGGSRGIGAAISKALKEAGYDDVISIENEDYSLDADAAISTSTAVLKFCINALNNRTA